MEKRRGGNARISSARNYSRAEVETKKSRPPLDPRLGQGEGEMSGLAEYLAKVPAPGIIARKKKGAG